MSDIKDYFGYDLKEQREKADNPSIKIFINKIEDRNTFKIKTV